MIKNEGKQLWFDLIEGLPVNPIWVVVSDRGLVLIEIGGLEDEFATMVANHYKASISKDETKTGDIIHQLTEYLLGKRKSFSFPIDWSWMTSFQEMVLKEVYKIPYGETGTYGQIALKVGKPGASRAVGRANATNPIPLVIPCHRVIGADGSLRGYGAGEGLKTKRWLLDLEQNI